MVRISVAIFFVVILSACKTSQLKDNRVTKPALIAHRGGMVTYPENSLISFEKATQYTKYIEMDIHFSKDNVPVVIHDATLNRTTNCQGKVSEKNWDELKECKLKEKLDWNYSEYSISQFNDILLSENLRNTILIVEIKDLNKKAINILLTKIKERGNIYIESFNQEILSYFHKRFYYGDLYLISYGIPEEIPSYVKGLILNAHKVTQNFLEQTELDIFLWTIDKEEDFKKYIQYKIDGIITNDIRYFNNYIKGGDDDKTN